MKKKIKEFYYDISDEKLKRYMNLSAKEKLQWLEEALIFSVKCKKVKKK